MAVHIVDPLTDDRWLGLLDRHPDASVFHTRGWLAALKRTYGYHPAVYTTDQPGEALTNGVPFCTVDSWLTGRRLVSLPFADHCEPLFDDETAFTEIVEFLVHMRSTEHWKYVELRPLARSLPQSNDTCGFSPHTSFYFNAIDLTRSLDELLSSFHTASVVRKIRRAERERLVHEQGTSDRMLSYFYQLFLVTRRKHGAPPQPLIWFRNLLDCMNGAATVHVASRDGVPVASILVISFRDKVCYKYGCSDPQFANLGGTAMLFWNAIRQAKEMNATVFDLGRSDIDNPGLIAFKDKWGSMRNIIQYYRYPAKLTSKRGSRVLGRVADSAVKHVPDGLMILAGKLLYKHMG